MPQSYAVAPGAGGSSQVQVFAADGTQALSFFAYPEAYTGGVAVALGNINRDQIDDVVTSTGPGGSANVRVFDGRTGGLLSSFFAYPPEFVGGVNVAIGDLNGDGLADIACGVGAGGGPNVRVFSGADGTLLLSFFAYDSAFTGGVRVALGDVTGDGTPDILCGVGSGGGPNVRYFDGRTGELVASYFAYPQEFTGGLFVAAGDLNGDGIAEVITGVESGGGPNVRVYDARAQTVTSSLFAFDPSLTGGVRVAARDITGDGLADILVGTGSGTAGRFRVFDGATGELIRDITPFGGFSGGVFVG